MLFQIHLNILIIYVNHINGFAIMIRICCFSCFGILCARLPLILRLFRYRLALIVSGGVNCFRLGFFGGLTGRGGSFESGPLVLSFDC